ncbi:hypothetical protein Mapa_001355 [Marchantia paleacea]|nr:hypothetical protein Mapa_001355 [Marchantia paleacea]
MYLHGPINDIQTPNKKLAAGRLTHFSNFSSAFAKKRFYENYRSLRCSLAKVDFLDMKM